MELYRTLWNFTFGGKVPELYGTFNVSYGTEQLRQYYLPWRDGRLS